MKGWGFCGPSYTLPTTAISDEECINRFLETLETPGAQTKWALMDCPGYATFCTLAESPVRGSCPANGRNFAVGGSKLYELKADGTVTELGTGANDSQAVSMVASNTQVFIVSAGHAYCLTLADNSIVEVTPQLAGVPVKVVYNDTYFIVCFKNSNKYQFSDVLDGTNWPGINVNAVSVFAENIGSLETNHRELWVYGTQHCEVYQDTGSSNTFDVVPGGFIETGIIAPFAVQRVDNSLFWINQDERGARIAWRASGYNPQRISTHAVEYDLASYADLSGLVTYAYQEAGHTFWVVYVPGSQWSWVYDVSTGTWHKRAEWDTTNAVWGAHRSWNHLYAFGKHLVGDWNSGNIYILSRDYIANGDNLLRRYRRTPTVVNEMQWITFTSLVIDYMTGLGPQPPLQDGAGNDREPQAMLRWSDDRGQTWSNEHTVGLGMAGKYLTRAIWWRLGRSRYRVWEESVTDPIRSDIIDAYLNSE